VQISKQFQSIIEVNRKKVLTDLLVIGVGASLICCSNKEMQKAALLDVNGKWTNKYANDIKLAGVTVDQFPEVANRKYLASYVGKHPAGVTYYFWDGRVKQCTFTPEGELLNAFWWAKDFLNRNTSLWSDVDFSAGSDPHFESHSDPRNKVAQ